MKSYNLDTLSYGISKAMATAVRVYCNGNELYSHSDIEFLADPVLPYLADIQKCHNKSGVYITPLLQIFGYFSLDDGHQFIIGPTKPVVGNSKEFEDLAFVLGIPTESHQLFLHQLNCAVPLSAMRLTSVMILIKSLIEGKNLDFTAFPNRDDDCTYSGEVAGASLLDAMTAPDDESRSINAEQSLQFEKLLMSFIREGQPERASAVFQEVQHLTPGQLARDTLRQIKNIGICSVTLATRASIEGGLSTATAFSLSDLYIQKIELLTLPQAVIALVESVFVDFATRVRDSLYGVHGASSLFCRCAQYISRNITRPIRIEEMSAELGISRSYLCTQFKKQTGTSLSQYILGEKVVETKRLLQHTQRSIGDIAVHLGFSSQSHLQNVFKATTGMTPNAFRQATL